MSHRLPIRGTDRTLAVVPIGGWDPMVVGSNVERAVSDILDPAGWYRFVHGLPQTDAILRAAAFAPGVDYVIDA